MIFHDVITYFFLVLHNIPLARCTPVYLFTDWIHFGKLHLWQALAIMNKAATNIHMQVLYEHSQTIFKMWIYVCDYIHKLLLTVLHNKSPWKVEAKNNHAFNSWFSGQAILTGLVWLALFSQLPSFTSGQLGIADLFCTLSQLCDYGWVKGADFTPNYVLSAASRLASNCTHDAWVGFLKSGRMQGALAG